MSDWVNETFTVIESAKPEHFTMVKGRPLDVEIEVNSLINKGYVLHGDIREYVLPGTNEKIFVQPMVKYKEEDE